VVYRVKKRRRLAAAASLVGEIVKAIVDAIQKTSVSTAPVLIPFCSATMMSR
jgi:hypothetical protein